MNKIIFFSTIKGVSEVNPIQQSSKFKFDWVESLREDYKKEISKNFGKNINLYKCPGIFDLMSEGFIVPMPWDLMIEPGPDGIDFRWGVPIIHPIDNVVSGHYPVNSVSHLPTKPNSLKTLIKALTPWHVLAPPGLKFLIIPIPYPDSYEFESVHGILDPSISTELNCQIRWNDVSKKGIIKAGTPMMQLIPLTDKSYDFIVRDQTQEDADFLEKLRYIQHMSFAPKRSIIRNAYNKFVSFGKKIF